MFHRPLNKIMKSSEIVSGTQFIELLKSIKKKPNCSKDDAQKALSKYLAANPYTIFDRGLFVVRLFKRNAIDNIDNCLVFFCLFAVEQLKENIKYIYFCKKMQFLV